MKRSLSSEYLGSPNPRIQLSTLDDKSLKRLKANVESEIEKRLDKNFHLVITGSNRPYVGNYENFCITISMGDAKVEEFQFLEEFLQEWFFSIQIHHCLEGEECSAFVVHNESVALKEISKAKESIGFARTKRLAWKDLRPIGEMNDCLEKMEKKNGERWSGQWGQPMYEDVLKVLLPDRLQIK